MAWVIWKKIKNGIQKGFNWVKNKIVKPAINIVKPLAKTILPAVGGVLGTKAGNPALGAKIGQIAGDVISNISTTASAPGT